MTSISTVTESGVLYEHEPDIVSKTTDSTEETVEEKPYEYKKQIVWRNVILFSALHIAALYGFYLIFASAKILTTLFGNPICFFFMLLIF